MNTLFQNSPLFHSFRKNKKKKITLNIARKLIQKGLAHQQGSRIRLNSYGFLAKKIGFRHYFELEELEKEWNSPYCKKIFWFNNVLIFFSVCLILILGWTILC